MNRKILIDIMALAGFLGSKIIFKFRRSRIIGNDYNGIIIEFEWKNMQNKTGSKYLPETQIYANKILVEKKLKSEKKIKSCSWCCLKDWQQFGILLFVRKWITAFLTFNKENI
eukprot:434572_1